MGTDTFNLNLGVDQLIALIKNMDQPLDCPAKTDRDYYVLAEKSDGFAGRVVLKDLKAQLPLDDLRRDKPDHQDNANLYIDVDGDYFPDLIEENEVYLVSEPFLECLRNTVHLRAKYIYNYIGLCAANNASIHTYCLVVPPQLDCILPGSARYDKAHCLTYFEIDDSQIGKTEIFRVKGFPHLIVTRPISRLNVAGLECARIEKYFDYAGVRDQDYRERLQGRPLAAALQEYERRVRLSDNYHYKYDLPSITELRAVRSEVATGLRGIFSSYQGPVFSAAELSARSLTFKSWGTEGKIVVTAAAGFSRTEFSLSFLPKALRYLETVPEVLKAPGREIVHQTILAALSQESRIFDSYDHIHGGKRFRLYYESDLVKTTNPPLVYDYQSPTQRAIANLPNFQKFAWQGQDLREYDFSGQTLSGLKITGADLTGAKFNDCNINNTEFSNCNLSGAEFKGANLTAAKFDRCELRRTNFNDAKMPKAELKGSELFQCSFVKTDLNGALFQNRQFYSTYFYRSKLIGAVFEVSRGLNNIVFRLCDLRRVKFTGNKTSGPMRLLNVISGCDFRNSDLSECRFAVNKIFASSFVKAKLYQSELDKCAMLVACDFRGSICAGLDLAGTRVSQCDFTKVDLSRLKFKSGTIFAGNNFTGANLSGYDFTVNGCLSPNNYTNANLTACRLENADFSAALVNQTNFHNANLRRATFTAAQLPFIHLSEMQRDEIDLSDENEADYDDGPDNNTDTTAEWKSTNGDDQNE